MVLPEGHTGSSFFHHVLAEAAAEFPQVLAAAALPGDAKEFKRSYGEVLVRFEAHRAAATERVAIARFIARRTQEQLHFADGEGSTPLSEYLAAAVAAPELARQQGSAAPGLTAEVPFEGRTYRGREVIELAELLRERAHMTDAALAATRWIVEHIEDQGGQLDLRGQRFAVLGAGAALAPTPLLLAAGAEVLWVDIAAPPAALVDGAAGSLVTGASDLLLQPREVAAAITRFAEPGAVHVGMFAYAAGASQEWRLGASMNGIVRSLPAACVRSVSLFVSPTTAANVQPEDVEAAATRLSAQPLWQAGLGMFGALPRDAHLRVGDATVSRSIVSIQGLSYQAAQYVSKIAAAETYAVYGSRLDTGEGEARPLTVSANVAGITGTRSLSHPIFQAAFIGAPSFGVQIFEPPTTRALSGLLILHDLLNPEAPASAQREIASAAERARALLSQQVHGGIYSLPYVLEPAIRASAILGMARRPGVMFAK